MGVVGPRNVKIAAANIVDGVIVDEKGTIRVFDRAVSRKYRIVWLNHGGGYTRSWVDGEFELGFLAIVGRESFEKERSET